MSKLNLTVERWAFVHPDAFLTGSIVQARNVLEMATQDIASLAADRDRTERNRDMWKGQCERQADQLRVRQWQPFATAPKDGTVVDLFSVSGHRWCGFRFDKEFPYPAWTEARYANSIWMDRPLIVPESITHWMPIPPGPGADLEKSATPTQTLSPHRRGGDA